MHWRETVPNLVRMLRYGGLLLITCACDGRVEHGTRRSRPEDAPFLQARGVWADYYQPVAPEDMGQMLRGFIPRVYEVHAGDHYFCGIKFKWQTPP